MTAISITNSAKALPAGNFRALEQESNYSTRNEFTEAIHTLLSNADGLEMPPSVRNLLKFLKKFIFNKNKIGVLYCDYEWLAEKIGYAIRSIERAFSWLRKMGFVATKRTKKPTNGRQAICIKTFAGLAAIKSIVADKMADKMAVCESDLNPWESKAEQPKNADDINTIIKNPLLKDLNINRIKENESDKQPIKKYKIKKEMAFLKNDSFYNAFGSDELKKHRVAEKIQFAFITTGARMTNETLQKTALDALKCFVNDIEKGRKQLKDDYYGALYTYIAKALQKEMDKQADGIIDLLNCWKPQEAEGTKIFNFEGHNSQEDKNANISPSESDLERFEQEKQKILASIRERNKPLDDLGVF